MSWAQPQLVQLGAYWEFPIDLPGLLRKHSLDDLPPANATTSLLAYSFLADFPQWADLDLGLLSIFKP
jgi:hypothetical protein